jgi:hypothetical protein
MIGLAFSFCSNETLWEKVGLSLIDGITRDLEEGLKESSPIVLLTGTYVPFQREGLANRFHR